MRNQTRLALATLPLVAAMWFAGFARADYVPGPCTGGIAGVICAPGEWTQPGYVESAGPDPYLSGSPGMIGGDDTRTRVPFLPLRRPTGESPPRSSGYACAQARPSLAAWARVRYAHRIAPTGLGEGTQPGRSGAHDFHPPRRRSKALLREECRSRVTHDHPRSPDFHPPRRRSKALLREECR